MHGHLTLLDTASGGDPTLLRAFALIEDRAGEFSDAQLIALRALVQDWVRPAQPAPSHQAVSHQAVSHQTVSPEPEPAGITARQRQILALLSEGLTVQAIARRLCLSPRTVGKHLERLYRRLGTSDRLTTVLRAQRSGLLAIRPALVTTLTTSS